MYCHCTNLQAYRGGILRRMPRVNAMNSCHTATMSEFGLFLAISSVLRAISAVPGCKVDATWYTANCTANCTAITTEECQYDANMIANCTANADITVCQLYFSCTAVVLQYNCDCTADVSTIVLPIVLPLRSPPSGLWFEF